MSQDNKEETIAERRIRILKLFIGDRKRIQKDISILVRKLKFVNELSDAQVEVLSMRQRLLEDMHTLVENVRSLESKLRQRKAQHFEEISKGQMLYKDREKTAIVEGKITDIKELLTLFQDQVDYYHESIKTLDGAHYGIKYRIDIEKATGI